MKKHLLYVALFCAMLTSSYLGASTKNSASSWYITAEPVPVLTCTYYFYTFNAALYFVQQITDLALYYQYYPDIYIYNGTTVCIELYTPGLFEITEYEAAMASAIDHLFFQEFAE